MSDINDSFGANDDTVINIRKAPKVKKDKALDVFEVSVGVPEESPKVDGEEDTFKDPNRVTDFSISEEWLNAQIKKEEEAGIEEPGGLMACSPELYKQMQENQAQIDAQPEVVPLWTTNMEEAPNHIFAIGGTMVTKEQFNVWSNSNLTVDELKETSRKLSRELSSNKEILAVYTKERIFKVHVSSQEAIKALPDVYDGVVVVGFVS